MLISGLEAAHGCQTGLDVERGCPVYCCAAAGSPVRLVAASGALADEGLLCAGGVPGAGKTQLGWGLGVTAVLPVCQATCMG